MHLLADDEVRLIEDLDLRNNNTTIADGLVLQPTSRSLILECRNLKEDRYYKVRAPNGFEGWAIRGRYRVERTPWNLFSVSTRVTCF